MKSMGKPTLLFQAPLKKGKESNASSETAIPSTVSQERQKNGV